jgi:hypothetical protein
MRRWAAAEQAGVEDDADAVVRTLFRAVPIRNAAAGFDERVAQAVARAALRQARLARLATVAVVICGCLLTVALLLQIPRLLNASLDLLIGSVVSATLALGRGLDLWTLLAQIARAVGTVVVTPGASYTLIVLGVVAIGALYGLHRLLEMEERTSL